KFILKNGDTFFEYLKEHAVEWSQYVEEKDTYFQHPSRDFSRTDEAFRIRERKVEDLLRKSPRKWETFLTYKGPKLDTQVKTREELELPLTGEVDCWVKMLGNLGFRRVETVEKVRRKTWYSWQDSSVEISLDEVHPVGNFVELELVVQEKWEVEEAREKILSFAQELGLKEVERRSYLDLILSHSSSIEGRK
ncbi:MAG: class IV adenylate cyclase, partial [Planctomycetia bacterium]|nr:class IV adenylate cyclase [Planctomycetia bacterium]